MTSHTCKVITGDKEDRRATFDKLDAEFNKIEEEIVQLKKSLTRLSNMLDESEEKLKKIDTSFLMEEK